MYEKFLFSLETIEQTRKYSSTLFEDKISISEWVVLFFLISVIYLSLVLANTGGALGLIIILSLSAVISYILINSYKLDQMKWKVDEKIFEPYGKVFDTLNLERYYPKDVIESGEIKRLFQKPPGTKYRVGYLPDYPDIKHRVIETHSV